MTEMPLTGRQHSWVTAEHFDAPALGWLDWPNAEDRDDTCIPQIPAVDYDTATLHYLNYVTVAKHTDSGLFICCFGNRYTKFKRPRPSPSFQFTPKNFHIFMQISSLSVTIVVFSFSPRIRSAWQRSGQKR
jgi:hypothetical protein